MITWEPTASVTAAASAALITAQPYLVVQQRQVVLTQIITEPDSTRTAIVTLGNGGASTGTSSASAPDDSGSEGLTREQIGIIVGCCLGALLLVILVWWYLTMLRRRREAFAGYEGSSYESFGSSYVSSVAEPRRTYGRTDAGWPPWRSIPPPVVPTYRARPIGPRYTANRAR